jgi:hypothetical protein
MRRGIGRTSLSPEKQNFWTKKPGSLPGILFGLELFNAFGF